jgi:hypothetical protein
VSTIKTVLVGHGTTPTGVGVVLTTEDKLTFTSPCCGALFIERGQSALDKNWSISAWCKSCDKEWTTLMFETEAVLYFEQELEHVNDDKRWLAGGLGVPEDQLEVTVE